MAATVSIKESKTILEGNLGTQNLTFDIVLSEAIPELVTVAFSISNATDTATIDEDYTVNFDRVVFNPSDPLTKTMTFAINGDRQIEADEIFTITLGESIGATLGTNSSATGTILNDDTLPKVLIGATTNASEPGGLGRFTLTRTGDLELPLTVNFNYLGSTATVNTDYSTAPTQVTFAGGASTATVAITLIDDDIYEGTESVRIAINNSESYQVGDTLGGGASAEIFILDNEILPIISITPLLQNIFETNVGDPAANASFQVKLSGKSATPITVDYTTVNGSAQAGSDFATTSGQLTFTPGGLTTQIVLVPITPDNNVEVDENFTFRLSNAIGASLGTPVTAIILNDDSAPLPKITINPIGDQNLPVEQLPNQNTITLKRDGDLTQPLTVKYLLSRSVGGTTQDINSTTTFAAGQSEITISLTINNTAIYREIEQDILTLTADPSYNLDNRNKTVTINLGNNQNPPNITISDAEIIEGDSGTNLLRFTALLSSPSAQATTVNYETQNGTAIAGKDYTSSTATLTFAAKEIEKIVEIPILNETIVESNENFTITLSNPSSGAILGKATATGLIKNNDIPIASLTITDAQAGEPNNLGQFQIAIEAAAEIPVTIKYGITGTANPGNDYTPLPGTVTIASGQTNQAIDVAIQDDNSLESTETVQLQLQASPDYTIAPDKNSGTISISDNDIANPQLIALQSSLFQIQNGAGTSIKFRKTNHQASYRNEVSLFTVDDDNGTINGVAPNQTGYQQAALGRAKVVFSALSDSSIDLQLDGQIDRYLQLGANDRFGLMLVSNSSIDELKRGVNADVLFSFPTANNNSPYTRITKQGAIQQVAWEDARGGDGDFNDLGWRYQSSKLPTSSALNNKAVKK